METNGTERYLCGQVVNEFDKVQKDWSSGYVRRLMFRSSWVGIPAPNTGWTFFTYICCKVCNVCLKRRK